MTGRRWKNTLQNTLWTGWRPNHIGYISYNDKQRRPQLNLWHWSCSHCCRLDRFVVNTAACLALERMLSSFVNTNLSIEDVDTFSLSLFTVKLEQRCPNTKWGLSIVWRWCSYPSTNSCWHTHKSQVTLTINWRELKKQKGFRAALHVTEVQKNNNKNWKE